MSGIADGPALDHFAALGEREANGRVIDSLAVGEVLGEHADIRVAAGDHRRRQVGSHEAAQAPEATVDYPHLDALPGVSRLVPGHRAVHRPSVPRHRRGPLIRLRGDDLPHAYDTRLLREPYQQGHRYVGLDVVLAHVARITPVLLQKPPHLIDVAGEVDGHRHRSSMGHGGAPGGVPNGGLSLLGLDHELIQVGAQLGVPLFLLLRGGRAGIACSRGHPHSAGAVGHRVPGRHHGRRDSR